MKTALPCSNLTTSLPTTSTKHHLPKPNPRKIKIWKWKKKKEENSLSGEKILALPKTAHHINVYSIAIFIYIFLEKFKDPSFPFVV